jgi:hypothetical protein
MNLAPADYRIVISQVGGEYGVESDFNDSGIYRACGEGGLSEREAMAAVEEMRFWLWIMSDHAKLIRNGFDLAEEDLFRYSDALAQNLDVMLARVQSACPPFSPEQVQSLIAESNAVTVPLREFKADLVVAIRECRVMTNRPAELIDHIRRESEFFLGVINGLVGGPYPTRCNLKIPAPSGKETEPAALAPRSLIPYMGPLAAAILQDGILFFTQINGEHAVVLSLYFRPEVQEELMEETEGHGTKLLGLLEELTRKVVQGSCLRDMKDIIARIREATISWLEHLRTLKAAVGACSVPTGQVNFPYSLLDHMEREGMYSIELLDMAQNM